MFDFQKEVILNNVDDVEIVGGTRNAIRIDGMIYKPEYIGPVYITDAEEAKKACLGIDLTAVSTAATAEGSTRYVQFVIELGLDNDYRGDFGSALYYFRKPVVVNLDVDALTDTDKVVKAFEKVSVSGEKLFTVVTDTDDPNMVEGASLTLVMNDCYITVRKAEAIGYHCVDSCNGEGMEMPVLLVDLKNTEGAYVPNIVGFGTYDYMIHNLRLPTHANWRFTSPAASEMPVPGGKYTQFSFEYTVPRRLGGLSVAGQKNFSTTIHTFFVLEGDVADDFVEMLSTVNITPIRPNIIISKGKYTNYPDGRDEAAPVTTLVIPC